MQETYYHVAAYFASLTNGLTNTPVTVVSDQVLPPSGTTAFLSPRPMQLIGMFSAGANITDARVNAPSFRYVGFPHSGPLNVTLTVPSPPNLTWFGDDGPTFQVAEPITVQHSLGGAAPENEFTLLFFQTGKKMNYVGPNYRIRATGTITGSAGTWVNGSMVFDDTLPPGIYAVMGIDAIGTNLVAVRLLFPGTFFRPGALARNTVGGVPSPVFTSGQLGCYGVFDSVSPPTVDIFVSGANTAQTFFLDLIRIRDRGS